MTACQHLVSTVEWQGVRYESRCGASPATEFINGWYCAAHRPSIIFRGVVEPAPDPAMSAAALAARHPGLVPVVTKEYGLPADPPEIAAREVRVYADHKRAVLDVMEDAAALITVGGMEAFAEVMAQAVLCAMDSKQEYVVGVRVPDADPIIFGPYPTAGQAQKAISDGHIVAYVEGQQAWILPLVPAPKAVRKTASKKKKAETTDSSE